jgi:hypothetical protein
MRPPSSCPVSVTACGPSLEFTVKPWTPPWDLDSLTRHHSKAATPFDVVVVAGTTGVCMHALMGDTTVAPWPVSTPSSTQPDQHERSGASVHGDICGDGGDSHITSGWAVLCSMRSATDVRYRCHIKIILYFLNTHKCMIFWTLFSERVFFLNSLLVQAAKRKSKGNSSQYPACMCIVSSSRWQCV